MSETMAERVAWHKAEITVTLTGAQWRQVSQILQAQAARDATSKNYRIRGRIATWAYKAIEAAIQAARK